MSKKSSNNLGPIIYEIDANLRESEKSFHLYKFNEKVEFFKEHCEIIKMCNEHMIHSAYSGEKIEHILKAFYGDNLSIDGCFQPTLETIYKKHFDGQLDKKRISEKREELLYEVEDYYAESELVLFMHDEICDSLIELGIINIDIHEQPA